MHTPGAETPSTEVFRSNGGVGAAAKDVAEHAGAIARLEAELAALELKQKVAALGIGIGLAVGAALCVLYMVGFLLATIAAALATFLPTWLALLIVTLALLAVAGILGLLARSSIRKGTPPVPEQAIEEAKLTTAAVKK
jgi:Putative Actinobacterial Holin-X, holin superfamily III